MKLKNIFKFLAHPLALAVEAGVDYLLFRLVGREDER